MSKKRGANSPSESDKMKIKSTTSAAVSTLGMAAVLSAVSHAFSGQGASSVPNNDSSSQASESEEEEYSQAIGGDSTITNDYDIDNDNPWNNVNLAKSQVKSPKKPETEKTKPIAPLFDYHQDGAWRDEIEVEIQTKNKKKFTGTITPTEAKHQIYIGALGYENHNNFDGVRINFKGKLIVTFKLIEPINIDELDAIEHFNFTRTTTVNGRKFEDVIGCRIRGLRYRPMMVSSLDTAPKDDGKRIVKIEGCEYRVPEEEILQWLSHYGEVTSKLEEDVFRDEQANDGIGDGTNRTGNYSVMMKLDKPIPQLLPMCGRRVKIYHAGIQKLCTNCFGPHKKSTCQNEKVAWVQYVQTFIEENDEFKPEMYGKWIDIIQKVRDEAPSQRNPVQTGLIRNDDIAPNTPPTEENKDQRASTDEASVPPATNQTDEERPPTENDFDIPTTKEAYESMLDRFKNAGLSQVEADEAIKTRTTSYNRACREYKKKQTEKKKQASGKSSNQSRRGSFKKQ